MAAGAEIIWVLEEDHQFNPGTAKLCMDTMDALDTPPVGWCVGDDQTRPEPGTFDASPFAEGRGFDFIVPRSTMTIEWVSNHGSPAGNDNPTAQDVLEAVQSVVAELGG